jgi:hypothetical protein
MTKSESSFAIVGFNERTYQSGGVVAVIKCEEEIAPKRSNLINKEATDDLVASAKLATTSTLTTLGEVRIQPPYSGICSKLHTLQVLRLLEGAMFTPRLSPPPA